MSTKTALSVLILASLFIAIPAGHAMAASAVPIQGVWTCTVVRAGTIERPIMYTFHGDGVFDYSSATTINSIAAGPVQNSGFHSRGGARGQWTKTSATVVNYKSVEFLYDANGNPGSFAVNANLLITPSGQLCSGNAACPSQTTSFSLVKYVFDQNDVDADIVGVMFLLPLNTQANVLCNRMSTGDGFPGIPVPMP